MNGGIFFYSTNSDGSLEWIGSAMIWLLLLLSLANVVLISLALSTNRRRATLPDGETDALRGLLSAGRYREAIERSGRGSSDLSIVLARTLENAPRGADAMTHAAETAADELLSARLRELERLNVLGQVAPMIGLFGTVYGMIVAFQTIMP
jgi:biopolymer transport protein ExbB